MLSDACQLSKVCCPLYPPYSIPNGSFQSRIGRYHKRLLCECPRKRCASPVADGCLLEPTCRRPRIPPMKKPCWCVATYLYGDIILTSELALTRRSEPLADLLYTIGLGDRLRIFRPLLTHKILAKGVVGQIPASQVSYTTYWGRRSGKSRFNRTRCR